MKLNVKNTGEDKGEFSISVTFEAKSWTWKGTQKTITLNDGETKQLTWEGKVPENAAAGSVARRIVYYGDSYKALDWWICVSSN